MFPSVSYSSHTFLFLLLLRQLRWNRYQARFYIFFITAIFVWHITLFLLSYNVLCWCRLFISYSYLQILKEYEIVKLVEAIVQAANRNNYSFRSTSHIITDYVLIITIIEKKNYYILYKWMEGSSLLCEFILNPSSKPKLNICHTI